MKAKILFLFAFWLAALFAASAKETNPAAVSALLDRIGGAGTSARFVTEVDAALSADGKDVFVITARDGKPCIQGNSISAVTTGINWYLNHYAHVNLAWNRLTADLSAATLPVPGSEERHACTADYRYYLNYCTFSYSMAFWTWERWQQEIDWMALHGIHMPLALVGADVVWKNVLEQLGYSLSEINAFIAGPGFQAWWLMNNLEGWGGPNKDWWYTRQETLSKNILARMRELGMTPVLPGYSGMVPHDITAKKGWTIADPGRWCQFQRPGFLLPTDSHFAEMAALYYQELEKVMGTSIYYSMDPFHEGGNTSGVDLPAAYTAIQTAMDKVNPDAKWVIQSWNENPRSECLNTIKKGKLVVLDLFSEAVPRWKDWNGYGGHEMVYCMLHNFGGRVGLHGRLKTMTQGYYDALRLYPQNLKGVGATPEGIETNPMLYDALFELPWTTVASSAEWLNGYATARYGAANADAAEAWQKLAQSVYDCPTSQQGTSEPVICARPALTVNSVSTWSTSAIYYNVYDVRRAVAALIAASSALGSNAAGADNLRYDLVDVTRQSLTDVANLLLKQIRSAYDSKDTERFTRLKALFLNLILDQDRLLSADSNFRLGRWTQMARRVPAEAGQGSAAADCNWMEWNARTQITVWGTEAAANWGGLHDYSNREWAGLLKDFHYARWQKFFDALVAGKAVPSASEWFAFEKAWTENYAQQYAAEPEGDALAVAPELFAKYFGTITDAAGTVFHLPLGLATDLSSETTLTAYRGETFAPVFSENIAAQIASFGIDLNGDGMIAADETVASAAFNIPAASATGTVKAQIALTDGTQLTLALLLRDDITAPRQVSVATADAAQGTVAIEGASELTVNSADAVTIKATPATGYDFLQWTDAAGNVVTSQNPYTYYGKEAAQFTAHFAVNKWGTVTENWADRNDIKNFEQYLVQMSVSQNGGSPVQIYSTAQIPATLFNVVPTAVNAPRGSSFTLSWSDSDRRGLSYCRLSAYIDLNADGDFTDEGEFLEVRGNKNQAGNSTVSVGTLQIVLPYDMPLGITHVRLRFDGAWSGGWDSVTDAKPATAEAGRPVYDVVVNVTELPALAPTVTVVSSDAAMGTVAISGLDNPATVRPGERIILQAQPKEGYRLDTWTDQYDRIVSREANYSFIPVETGTFTANFAKDSSSDIKKKNLPLAQGNPQIYDLSGRLHGAADSPLPAGVYIEKTDNATRKVLRK